MAVSNDEFFVDLSTYRDLVGGRVEPGRYRVAVEDAEQGMSKAGNPMLTLWFRVLDGDSTGFTILDRLTLTDAAMFRMVGFLQALGFPTPKKRLKFNLRQFVGRTLEIDVEDGEPYMGRVKSEVRGYMRSTRADKQIADLDGLAEFATDEPLPAEPPPTNGEPKRPDFTDYRDDGGIGTVDLETLDL